MTRKDFQLIAEVIAQTYHKFGPTEADEAEGVMYLAGNMADALATTNPRFDRQRFLYACTAEPKPGE